jgi:hypothetical protein
VAKTSHKKFRHFSKKRQKKITKNTFQKNEKKKKFKNKKLRTAHFSLVVKKNYTKKIHRFARISCPRGEFWVVRLLHDAWL